MAVIIAVGLLHLAALAAALILAETAFRGLKRLKWFRRLMSKVTR